MRYPLVLFVLSAIAVCGCDDGAQQGRFAVSGSSSRPVAEVTGSFTIVRGDAQPLTPQSAGRQPLLYILVLAPSVTASGSGSSYDDGKVVSTHKETWHTAQGPVSVELSWDRQTDQVSAGDATFDRQRGNVFVLIRDPSGTIAVTQAGPVSAGLDEFVALPQIQAALPADSAAKNVTLVR